MRLAPDTSSLNILAFPEISPLEAPEQSISSMPKSPETSTLDAPLQSMLRFELFKSCASRELAPDNSISSIFGSEILAMENQPLLPIR